ncbi:hypothetical protein JHK86_002591 [Glycine max]|nr:hypothetical protein JHK86_002591 [Glycine max]
MANAGNILFRKEADGHTLLIPIDHGYCLLEKDCTFDWLYWPQARQHYSPDTIDYIKSLDAEKDIELLKYYKWDVPIECAQTLCISTMLLKKEVERGLTPFDIGSIMGLWEGLRVNTEVGLVWQSMNLNVDPDFLLNNAVHWLKKNLVGPKGRSLDNYFLVHLEGSTSSFHQPRQHGLVHWSPHSDLFFKLNTDGSPLGNLGPSGFGGVIRNGQWFFSFFWFCEVFAICNGLKLAYDRGIHNLVCESDSKIVWHLIKENKNPFQPYNAFIHKIQQYIVEPWHLSFKRETIARFG